MKRAQFLKLLVFLGVLIAFLSAGFYVGAIYGPSALKTEAKRQAEIAAAEQDIRSGLDTGSFLAVVGRIKAVDATAGTFVFLDQTLGTINKAPGGFVQRTIRLDVRTVLAKEEVSGGPHFPIRLDDLNPGQSVTVYIPKNDLSEDNAVAKEVVLYQYIPAQQN